MNHHRAKGQGFTLVEVMIVVAIIGILSTLAYPSYRDHILRGRIPDGLALLSNEKVVMEKFLGDNRAYLLTPGGPHACTRYPLATTHFTVSCVAGWTNTSYTLQVVGNPSMAGFEYRINESGLRTTQSLPAGWALPAPNNCWARKKDGAC